MGAAPNHIAEKKVLSTNNLDRRRRGDASRLLNASQPNAETKFGIVITSLSQRCTDYNNNTQSHIQSDEKAATKNSSSLSSA